MTQATRQFGLALGAMALSLVLVLGSLLLSLMEGGFGLAIVTQPSIILSPTMQISQTPTPAVVLAPGEPTYTPLPPPTNTLIPTPTPGCPLPQGWSQISVQVGDSAESLAAEFGTTVEVLIQANCLNNSNQVMAGMVLSVPPFTPPEQVSQPTAKPTVKCGPPRNWVTIIIQRGDTLYQLSLRYGVKVEQLQAANCLGSSIHIEAGQKLYVPYIPPTATPSLTHTLTPTPTITKTPETPTATVIKKAVMTVKKSSSMASLSTPTTVPYSYLVTNTGNVTLTGIVLSDNNDDNNMSCPSTSLAPGGTMTCTATHTFTQAELDAGGSLDNVVMAVSKEAPDVTDDLSITIFQDPALMVEKSSPIFELTKPETVAYSYQVTNTGNVTLTGISLSDDNDNDDMSCLKTSLTPGESMTCTATHTFTQEELDAGGSLDNTVTASSNEAQDATDSLSIPIIQDPKMTVDKTSTTTSLSTAPTTVNYSYMVENTGNVTLTGIDLLDNKINKNNINCSNKTSLSPGGTMTCTATYNFTPAELIPDTFLVNTVTVSSNEAQDATDSLSIPITPPPATPLNPI